MSTLAKSNPGWATHPSVALWRQDYAVRSDRVARDTPVRLYQTGEAKPRLAVVLSLRRQKQDQIDTELYKMMWIGVQ